MHIYNSKQIHHVVYTAAAVAEELHRRVQPDEQKHTYVIVRNASEK